MDSSIERGDRLEGTTGNEFGGLIKRKGDDHLFKKPSLLGLDKLAKARRQENLRRQDDSTRSESGLSDSVRSEIRRFVLIFHLFTCCLSIIFRHRDKEDRNDRRGLVADSRDRRHRHDSPDDNERRRSRDDYNRRDRHRRDRDSRNRYDNRDRGSERQGKRFDEPETPQFKVPSTPSSSAWDEDDEKLWKIDKKGGK